MFSEKNTKFGFIIRTRCYQFQLNLTRGGACHQEHLKNCSHHSNAGLYFITGVTDVSAN